MTPQEKNQHELKLVQLKAKFIKIGVYKMPTEIILTFMPKSLKGANAVKWARVASNVWNGRSAKYTTYLPIFEKAFNTLEDTEIIEN